MKKKINDDEMMNEIIDFLHETFAKCVRWIKKQKKDGKPMLTYIGDSKNGKRPVQSKRSE